MYKQRVGFFIFVSLVCFQTNYAQISTSVSVVNICAPDIVTYTAPVGATGSWNFGNGDSPGTLPVGTANYNNPGVYLAVYSGNIGGTPINATVTVNANPKPVPNFSITPPLSGCAPKTVTLTNMSTGAGINSWLWSHGDGSPSTLIPTPSHTYTYTILGNFSISLQVTDVNGCYGQITIGTVSVFATPTAVIGSNPVNLSSCTPPFSAAFSASNSLGPNLTYAWNFGNGQTSTGVSSNQTYNTQGNYPVTLTVTSNGCSSVASQTVVVNSTTLSASVPPTVCLNAPFTVTVASNQTSTFWNLGNGIVAQVPATANSATQTVGGVFTTPGVKTITITAGFGNCQATLTKLVTVEQVSAGVTSPLPNFSCASPFNVGLINTSSPNAIQFNFFVPAFQQSTVMPPPASNTLTYQFTGSNPTFTIPYVQGSLNQYANFNSPYSLAYAPSVTMVASSVNGCSNTVVFALDSITKPAASFYINKKNGCAPLTVNFNSNSYTFAHDPITSYTWCNGATPPVFVTGVGPSVNTQTFVYSTVGTYSPYLIIQTAAGCADVSFTEQITVSNPPVISFNFTPTTVCPNEAVQIINTTAPNVMSTINHWHVGSDNGYFSGCINDPNPSWRFTNVGVHTVSMSAYVNGCRSDVVSVTQVTVNGPIVSGRYETNCVNRMAVSFSSTLQSATSATLNFGDGSPTHTMTNGGGTVTDVVMHTYTLTGDYTVTLSGANPLTGCPISTYTMLVTVRNAQASLSSVTVACMNTAVNFDGSASQDVRVGCSRGYIWYVDNLPPLENTSPTFSTAFLSAGMHSVTLVVKDINSCRDEAVQAIRISSATADFSFSSPNVCVNSPFQLINTSSSVPEDPLVSYNWTFDDGQTSTTFSPSHTFANAVHPFTSHAVTLKVTNSFGCQSLPVTKNIQVLRPNTVFTASQYSICLGPTNVSFSVLPNAGGTYTMFFGPVSGPVASSSISTSPVFNHTYTLPGTYSVGLRVKDGSGCLADGNPLFILAQVTPTANFSFSSPKSITDKPVICSPATVDFTSTSQPSTQTYTYNWDLNFGAPVVPLISVSQAYTYSLTQTVPVSLTVSTSNQCRSTITKTFTLYNPRAKINVDRFQICLRDEVKFNIKDTAGSGVSGWAWIYRDGVQVNADTVLANASPPSFTVHPYNLYPAPSGTVEVSLYYFSAEKACRDVATTTITILKVDADFKRNGELAKPDSVHCIRIQDNFTNISPNSNGSSFRWGFGNGEVSSLQNPQYTYPLPGVYQVTLVVTATNTCKGISTKNMTINPLPVASISSKDSICQDSPFDLIGAGTSTAGITGYQWSPPSAVTNPGLGTTVASSGSSIAPVYSLSVTDGNNCVSDPATHTVYIQPPPPQLVWDTTVIVGQQVPIHAYVGSFFSYSWSPVADLNCITCANPLSTSTVNITYSVEIQDGMKCFAVTNTYSVFIDPQTSVDVPTAFTPNGDGINDVIFPDGWGIKKLYYFKVFNRWGQLLFETNEIKVGWDGTFNGVPQNMETYVYQVSVETYLDDKPLQKTSSFKLIR